MDALVVVESWFGGTRALADEVARGMEDGGARVRVIPVGDAPAAIPDGVDAVVVGAPTHNRGLSTPATRRQARAKAGAAGAPSSAEGRGTREWLDAVDLPAGATVAVFDTATGRSWMNGSAARAAVKLLARRGVTCRSTETFLVPASGGEVAADQLEAARTWGGRLVG